MEASVVAVPEESGAPVQGLVGLDAGSGAGRAGLAGKVGGRADGVAAVEGVKVRALLSREESRVNLLVGHGSSAVEEAEVVAMAVKGRGGGGHGRRNSEDVGEHDVVIEGGIEISDRGNRSAKECI